jgi:hypothetical protein
VQTCQGAKELVDRAITLIFALEIKSVRGYQEYIQLSSAYVLSHVSWQVCIESKLAQNDAQDARRPRQGSILGLLRTHSYIGVRME